MHLKLILIVNLILFTGPKTFISSSIKPNTLVSSYSRLKACVLSAVLAMGLIKPITGLSILNETEPIPAETKIEPVLKLIEPIPAETKIELVDETTAFIDSTQFEEVIKLFKKIEESEEFKRQTFIPDEKGFTVSQLIIAFYMVTAGALGAVLIPYFLIKKGNTFLKILILKAGLTNASKESLNPSLLDLVKVFMFSSLSKIKFMVKTPFDHWRYGVKPSESFLEFTKTPSEPRPILSFYDKFEVNPNFDFKSEKLAIFKESAELYRLFSENLNDKKYGSNVGIHHLIVHELLDEDLKDKINVESLRSILNYYNPQVQGLIKPLKTLNELRELRSKFYSIKPISLTPKEPFNLKKQFLLEKDVSSSVFEKDLSTIVEVLHLKQREVMVLTHILVTWQQSLEKHRFQLKKEKVGLEKSCQMLKILENFIKTLHQRPDLLNPENPLAFEKFMQHVEKDKSECLLKIKENQEVLALLPPPDLIRAQVQGYFELMEKYIFLQLELKNYMEKRKKLAS